MQAQFAGIDIIDDSHRQPQSGDAAGGGFTIFERQGSTVIFGDLAAEDKADAGTRRFGGEKRDEQILRAGDSRAVVFNGDFDLPGQFSPCHADVAGVGFFHRFHGVFHQVDDDLFDLGYIDRQLDFRTLD